MVSFPETIKLNEWPQVLINSLANGTGSENHFCKVYSASMKNIACQMQFCNQTTIGFINRFLFNFAFSFASSWKLHKQSRLPNTDNWSLLYSNPPLKPWQLVLIGVNAHINGDIHQVLIESFSEQELINQKKNFLSAQHSLKVVYRSFFRDLEKQNRFFRIINTLTFRFPELMGARLIYNWRHRQYKLALCYFQNPSKFEKFLTRVKRKKENIDQLILKFN